MKRVAPLTIALALLTLAAIPAFVTQSAPQAIVSVDTKAVHPIRHNSGSYQDFVVCTGWHALCSASNDCEMKGDQASCDCMRVDEAHIVATDEIQDTLVRRITQNRCTTKHPCDVDEAPICKTIKHQRYQVNNARYDWVSTYSYTGWCSILERGLKACDQRATSYNGDYFWAICDAAPCTENQNPSDPERPLSCQCRVEDTPFVGMNGSCTGEDGGIMSSMPLWAWDFQNETYPFRMPGYEYVEGACAPLKSDQLGEPRR
jgi:hypothetical protein